MECRVWKRNHLLTVYVVKISPSTHLSHLYFFLYKFKTLFLILSLWFSSYYLCSHQHKSNINLPLLISSSTSGHQQTTYQEALLWNILSVKLKSLTPKLCFTSRLSQHLQCWGCCLWLRCWLGSALFTSLLLRTWALSSTLQLEDSIVLLTKHK